ncbi:ubiquitin-conjugating enzyme/RWD-like protein [Mrakia frigida]|uniref:ubiquitin-conjugating enzyme/RWD-like protein n=1 Tax=Mrakia frigida TaxID=29902 RepID=UPI003FCC270B
MTDAIPASSIRRIAKELNQLRADPPEGIRVVVDEEDISQFTAWVQGPDGTPYAGGYFRVRFAFGATYPSQPPKCTFASKIFHPNVSKQGDICVDTLKKGWKPEFGISHVLSVIRCLLIYPNPESALDEEAGKLLLEAYEDYCKHARLFTSIHATPRNPPPEFLVPSTSTSTATATKSASSTPPPSSSSHSSPLLPLQSNSHTQPNAGFSATSSSSGPTKPVVAEKTAVGGAKPAVKAGAKRGLKRL